MRNLSLVLLILVVTSFPQLAHADRISCPTVIGDLNTGEYRRARGNYECYEETRDAKKRGFTQGSSSGHGTLYFTGYTNTVTDSFRISSQPAKVKYNFVGGGNFYVWLYKASNGERVDLLANDIDSISGSKSIRENGNFYMEVHGVGYWTIDIEP